MWGVDHPILVAILVIGKVYHIWMDRTQTLVSWNIQRVAAVIGKVTEWIIVGSDLNCIVRACASACPDNVPLTVGPPCQPR
jgi:hypothetical protein